MYNDEGPAQNQMDATMPTERNLEGHPIEAAYTELTRNIAHLEDMLKVFTQRIDPVLAPEEPSSETRNEVDKKPSRSMMANFINAEASRVRSLIVNMSKTLDRLEL